MKPAIEVSVADPRLARALRRAIDGAVRRTVAKLSANDLAQTRRPVVHLRTGKRLAALGEGELRGAIAVVRVTRVNARRLPGLVDAIRATGAAGIQLVWDGCDPERAHVERYVFEVLERARATPDGPPVVLARSTTPVDALRILIAFRNSQKGRSS